MYIIPFVFFILFHRAGGFAQRGVEAAPAEECFKKGEAGEEDDERVPRGGDSP
jgi:hypothetical protein